MFTECNQTDDNAFTQERDCTLNKNASLTVFLPVFWQEHYSQS